MPAEMAYGPLLKAIGDQIRPVTKELEVYAGDVLAPDYGLDKEVEGIRKVADAEGFERFNLVGYSAGGASSLAFTARYPERLLSLALIEPAWIGRIAPEDAKDWEWINQLMKLPADERMREFQRWQMLPGVEPPALPIPAGEPPAWMKKRPAGLIAFMQAFNTYQLDTRRFKLLRGPVYFALGSLSTRYYARAAKTLGGLFADLQVEEYVGRSHLDPPHRTEAERFGKAMLALWKQD
jgi:pimeloyl-ACP methyl ester carboxylesterase